MSAPIALREAFNNPATTPTTVTTVHFDPLSDMPANQNNSQRRQYIG